MKQTPKETFRKAFADSKTWQKISGGDGLKGAMGSIYDLLPGQYAHEKDIDAWKMMNEYNHPAQQMARLEEAGLNPSLMYSSGSTAVGNAPSIQKHQGGRIPGSQALPQLANMLQTFADLKIKNAQEDNIKSQTRVNNVKNALDAIRLSVDSQWAQAMAELSFQTKSNEKRKSYYDSFSSLWGSKKGYYDYRSSEENLKWLRDTLVPRIEREPYVTNTYQANALSAWQNSIMAEIERKWRKAEKWLGIPGKILGGLPIKNR